MYHATLAVLLFIALAGAEIFAKVNGLLFGALVVAVLVVLFSMLFQPSFHVELMPAYGNMSCNAIVRLSRAPLLLDKEETIPPSVAECTRDVRSDAPGRSRAVVAQHRTAPHRTVPLEDWACSLTRPPC